MTPQKSHFHLPLIIETPNTSALIKSIVQSAKKTGLNSSPVRVPFALSPMAFKFAETKLNFSPMKAKEPSQVIKEAFLHHVEIGDEEISLPFDNKRPHEELELGFEEKENDLEEEQEGELHMNKREKLEQGEQEYIYHDNKDESEHKHKQKEVDMNEYINNSHEMKSETSYHSYTDITNITESVSSSFDSLPSPSPSLNSSSTPLVPSASRSINALPPTNFSTDLLRNLKDPEFSSPELSSAPDYRVSRSEGHDKHATESTYKVNGVLSKSSCFGSSSSTSTSTSTSTSSSTNNHPLLPSGIVKLLEKKRLEKEQQQQFTSSVTATGKEGKKKFDLKESLKRPLNYKPHIGSIPKRDKDF